MRFRYIFFDLDGTVISFDLIPGMLDILKRLSEIPGLTVGVNSTRGECRTILKRYGIDEYFNGPCLPWHRWNKGLALKKFCDENRVDPVDVVMVGDLYGMDYVDVITALPSIGLVALFRDEWCMRTTVDAIRSGAHASFPQIGSGDPKLVYIRREWEDFRRLLELDPE